MDGKLARNASNEKKKGKKWIFSLEYKYFQT